MSIFCILTNDLKKRKISAQWVPHCLTAEQRLDIATLLKLCLPGSMWACIVVQQNKSTQELVSLAR